MPNATPLITDAPSARPVEASRGRALTRDADTRTRNTEQKDGGIPERRGSREDGSGVGEPRVGPREVLLKGHTLGLTGPHSAATF